MPSSYQDRVVVITGASRGLGAGMAQTLHAKGLRLGLCARSQPVLDSSERVLSRRLDVQDACAVEAFCAEVVQQFGRLDLWINNAGVLEPVAPVREIASQDFLHNLQVNVLGVLHGTQAYVRYLRAQVPSVEGVLINISSGAGQKGYAGWAAYCAAKAAVDRLTESVQLEEAGQLRAHAVAPGVIDTDMQVLVRSSNPAIFPAVERFRELKRRDAFNTPAFVAERLLEIAFEPRSRPSQVVVRLPEQPR